MKKIVALLIWAASCFIAAANTNAFDTAVEKHIAQICAAYGGQEMRENRRLIRVDLDSKMQLTDIVVLFEVDKIPFFNSYIQFVSILRQSGAETPEPFYFQRLGTRGGMHFKELHKADRGAMLTGTDHGSGDSMADPSLECTVLLTYTNEMITLTKKTRKRKASTQSKATPK